MNKTKKIAFAAVAVVMAGTMAGSMAACTPGTNTPTGPSLSAEMSITKPTNLAANLKPSVDANDNLTYSKDGSITLNMNIGDGNNSIKRSIAFPEGSISGEVTLPDGKTYKNKDLKAPWQALQDILGVTIVDDYQNLSSDNQILNVANGINGTFADYQVITGSSNQITIRADSFLNLRDYLYYMPNYAAFLEKYDTVALSTTSDTTTGGMYYAPYFDGFDDVEKYTLAEKNWIEGLLDGTVTDTTTFNDSLTEKGLTYGNSNVTAYMGQTGSWTVETTDPDDSTQMNTVNLVVNYDAAGDAARSASSPLGTAYQAAAGAAYTGTSGNIVDIMNAALDAKQGNVTGAQLSAILQAYIDVAYQTESGDKFYDTRSDVFNSISAGWDVDLLVAISRCAVTSPKALGEENGELSNLYGLSGRQQNTQRRTDLVAFAGELYGVRGMESRYEFSYINSEGDLVDARNSAATWDTIARMGELAKEGLVCTTNTNINGSRDSASGPAPLFIHDYSQTQTTAGIVSSTNGYTDPDATANTEDFNVAPILTAVSKWDTDDNGERETIMRFTESWRSVKNTGFAIPVAAVQGNPELLSATLAFVDYFFSNDGQILMTYGTQSTNGNTNPNGWWYANEATNVNIADVAEYATVDVAQVEGVEAKEQIVSDQYTIKDEYASQYFIYNNKVYTGFAYKDTQVPIITDANDEFFRGFEVNGLAQVSGSAVSGMSNVGSYTNYARYFIGSTLPIGNKNQGFEYQCTAACAIAGANIVSAALVNGTIKHVSVTLGEAEGWWYLIAPTTVALNAIERDTMANDTQTALGQYFYNNSSTTTYRTNAIIDMVLYGFDTSRKIAGQDTYENIPENGAAMVELLKNKGLTQRTNIATSCWTRTKALFNITLNND